MSSQRTRSFYYLMLTFATLTFSSFTKLVFIQPRPFWVSPDVQAFDCWADFGNPGQHMMFASSIVLASFLDFNSWVNESAESIMANGDSGSLWESWWVRTLLALLGALFTAFIGYTSFYTGANSGNQILLGFQLGIWIALVFHFMVRDWLFKTI